MTSEMEIIDPMPVRKQVLDARTTSKSNYTCLTCGKEGFVDYCWINFSIWLCGPCGAFFSAMIDTPYKLELLHIRSDEDLYNWTTDHAKRVKYGGNRRFKEFLEQAQIANDFPLASPDLYLTNAAYLYTRILDARVREETEFMELVDFEMNRQWARESCRLKDDLIYPSIDGADGESTPSSVPVERIGIKRDETKGGRNGVLHDSGADQDSASIKRDEEKKRIEGFALIVPQTYSEVANARASIAKKPVDPDDVFNDESEEYFTRNEEEEKDPALTVIPSKERSVNDGDRSKLKTFEDPNKILEKVWSGVQTTKDYAKLAKESITQKVKETAQHETTQQYLGSGKQLISSMTGFLSNKASTLKDRFSWSSFGLKKDNNNNNPHNHSNGEKKQHLANFVTTPVSSSVSLK